MLEDVEGQHGWTWTGDIGTFSSVFLVIPERHLGVAVMGNYDAPGLMNQLARGMVKIALDGSAEPLPRSLPVNVTPAVEPDRTSWDSYVGQYSAPRDAIRISRVGDRLVATIAGGDILAIASALGPNEGRTLDLVPTSPTQFVLLGETTVLDGAPVSFKVGSDGIPVLLLGGAPFGARQ
jgi:CubicO group peptidase (beta-lactamase class C family)